MPNQLKEKGFTLVELMITVVLVAIAAALAVPSLYDFVRNGKIATQTNLLVGSLNYARNEAITRGVPVTVCASEDGQTCSGTNNWNAGWIIYTDKSQAGHVDAGDTVLRVVTQSDTQGIAIGYSNAPYIQFTSTGFIQQTNLQQSWFANPTVQNEVITPVALTQVASVPRQAWMNQLVWMVLPGRNVYAAATTTTSSSTTSSTTNLQSTPTIDPSTETLLSVCDTQRSGEQGNAIIINRSGQIRLVKVMCN